MLSIDNKKWLIFTENEVNILTNSIENSKYKDTFISCKKDIKKFLVYHFRINEAISNKNTGILSDISKLLKNFTKGNTPTKSLKKEQKTNVSNKGLKKEQKTNKNGPKNGFKILSVSNKYIFPLTVYKKKDEMKFQKVL